MGIRFYHTDIFQFLQYSVINSFISDKSEGIGNVKDNVAVMNGARVGLDRDQLLGRLRSPSWINPSVIRKHPVCRLTQARRNDASSSNCHTNLETFNISLIHSSFS